MSVDQTVISSGSQLVLDRSVKELISGRFRSKSISETRNPEGEVQSISVPRKEFRKAILSDLVFRRALRSSGASIQDIQTKRRRVNLGPTMDSKVYVSDTKSVGLKFSQKGSDINFKLSFTQLQDTLEDWAQIKIPAIVLLLMIGGTVYVGARLGKSLNSVFSDYNEALEKAMDSDENLEAYVEKRGGFQSPPIDPPVQTEASEVPPPGSGEELEIVEEKAEN